MQQTYQESTAICPADRQVNKHRWCTFEINNPNFAAIQCGYFVCLIILSIVLLRFVCLLVKYRNSIRYKKYFGEMYTWIYKVLGLWLGCTCARALQSLIIFYVYMMDDFPDRDKDLHPDDPEIGSALVIFSCIQYFLNSICAFLLNLAIVLIPYQWLKIELYILDQMDDLDQYIQKKIKIWKVVLKIARIYSKYVRNIFIIILVIEPFLFYLSQNMRCRIIPFNVYFIILQAVLFMCFYIFTAYVSCYLNNKQLIKIQPNQSLRMKIYYLILFVASAFRVGRTVILMYGFFGIREQLNGPNSIYQIIYIISYHGLLHVLPITIILYIYQPSIQKLKKYEDLMDIDCRSDIDEPEMNFNTIARTFFKSSLKTESSQRSNSINAIEYS